MRLGFDHTELALIALIVGIILLGEILPPRFGMWVSRRFFPHSRSRRGWREWTWPERIAIAVPLAVLAALWIHGIRSLGSFMAVVGILMLVISIKGLLRAKRP